MEQRRLRLGDILDDYCPRERRVTNHAVVAMIEDEVKQTRCTTCDAEHVYKGARVPKRRKKETPAALYKEVLATMPEPDPDTALVDATTPETMSDIPDTPPALVEAAPPPAMEPEPSADINELELPSPVEDGPVHRQLLRAKLPRPEGQKDARPLPEFTVRQSGNRNNGQFRGGGQRPRSGDPRAQRGSREMMGRGNGGPVNGNRAHGGGGRFQGGPHRNQGGNRGGSQNPFRGGQPRHGGKKGRG